MAFEIYIKPINKWIGNETKNPGNSQFRQNYSNTKQLLQFELEKLHAIASSVQLEMFIRPEDLRRDGILLRAHAKPFKPGVVLSFSVIARRLRNKTTGEIRNETKTLSYPCDVFSDWQDNVRAVALSLEALRKLARYGVFKYEDMLSRLALPSAEGEVSDRDSALQFLAEHSDYILKELLRDDTYHKSAYRAAAQKLHPDKDDSYSEEFLKLQGVKKILGL